MKTCAAEFTNDADVAIDRVLDDYAVSCYSIQKSLISKKKQLH